MPVVKIPTPLRGFAGGRAAVPLDGPTVSSVLEALLADSPALRPHLFGEDGTLRNFVNKR